MWFNEQLDDIPAFDMAVDFRGGMNTTMAPSLLPQTQYSLGENVVLNKAGGLESRYGTSQLVSSSNATDLIYFDTPSYEQLLMFRDSEMKKFDGSSTSTVSGYTGTGTVSLMQGIDRCYAATSGELFEYAGTNAYAVRRLSLTITNGGSGYTSATVAVSGGGSPEEAAVIEATVAGGVVTVLNITNPGRGYTSAPTITINGDGSNAAATATLISPPTGSIATWHTNRMFLAGISGKSDTIRVSDLLDPSYWAAANSFRVGGGEGESIRALKSWDIQNLLVFKDSSTYLVQTDPTASVADWPIQKVSDTVGCVSADTAVQVGADVWWLSRQGVVSVRRMAQETQREISVAISAPIQSYMDRIAWAYASTARAAFYQNMYLLAVPLDSATVPSHILVYDTIHQCWAGVWTGLNLKDIAITNFSSVQSLVFSTSGGDVVKYDPTKEKDAVQGTDTNITSKAHLRGMSFADMVSPKTAVNCEVEFFQSTGKPSLTISFDEGDPVTIKSLMDTGAGLLTLPFEEEDSEVLEGYGTKSFSFSLLGNTQFRSMQPRLESSTGKMHLRTLKASAFLDTIELHTA